jgi:N-ethylmaleimide reductase
VLALQRAPLDIAAPGSDALMSNQHLLQGFNFGSLQLSNRVVLAPLTRGRSGDSGEPNGVNAEYYAQRASAGLIITEAAAISKQGYGWAGAPGMYNDEQQVSTTHHFILDYGA